MSRPILKFLRPIALSMAVTAAPAAVAQDAHARFGADALRPASGGRGAGDDRAVFEALLEAARGGHVKAQRRLGEVYDAGGAAVRRDLLESIRWYQAARDQGEHITSPARRSFGVVGPNI